MQATFSEYNAIIPEIKSKKKNLSPGS
jgi:hypothetical protein